MAEKSVQIKKQRAEAESEIAQLLSTKQRYEEEAEAFKNLRMSMIDTKKQHYDSVTKEMKNINKQNLIKLKAHISQKPEDPVTTFLSDSLTKFLGGNARFLYSENGAVYFVTEADLHMHIRNCDYSALDRGTIESIMSRMIQAAEEEEPAESSGKFGDIFEML